LENGCPRWEQLDEEMGFFDEPEEDKVSLVADMAGMVVGFWGPDAPFIDKIKDIFQESDIERGECIIQEGFLRVVNRRDEMRRLPPTYANAKAVKRDHMSTLLGNNGLGQRDPVGSPIDVKVCRTPHFKIWWYKTYMVYK